VSRQTEVLVLGAHGMLGSACLRAFGPAALGRDREDFDLAEASETSRAIGQLRPRMIINCAAATDVDRCETDREYADRGNIMTAANAAAVAAHLNARFVHISTDFVFPGDKGEPYEETDLPQPLSYYGQSKLAGELQVQLACPDALIIRTSWLYGDGGVHFPGKVLEWAAGGSPLKVVDDQTGSPTYAEDLAVCIRELTERQATRIYHLGGSGCATRFEWAKEMVALAGLDNEVLPAKSADFPLPAARPANSCLDCQKAADQGVQLPPWREGLARYVRSLQAS